ncbi:putative ribonuclease H-like domain-containing protein [Tanacetum coccineum]
MTKNVTEHVEPKKVIQALIDPSWIEAMQDELLQNKKDDRGIVVRNKARLVAQGYTQEEGIDYDEVFAPVARIEAINFEHLHYVCDKKVIRPVWNNSSRVNHKNFANKITHPHPNRRFVPQAVLTRSGKINTVGASVNTAGARINIVVRPVNTAGSKPTGNPQQKEYKEKGVIDSGCSRHMTGNKCYLIEYKHYDGEFVSFGDGKGRISRKGKIKTGTLDFDNVYFCKELKYNLFSVSQICDKKNNVLFTDTECLVLSSNFKLLDESQVLLRVPRKDNIYSVDLKSVIPTKGLTCLFAKAIIDESNLWHRRLGHTNFRVTAKIILVFTLNFKNMNKLVRGNLVRGLPLKIFENDHSCVACQKGKQHKASCKAKLVNSISKPLHMLHMDLFGPTNVKSLMKKSYCLVVTDDFSRFSWVFFLATKDETSGVLKTFITEIKNQLDYKVKVIRSDNRTEFKNSVINQFCEMKGITREFSVARTPQQNGVAEKRNRTLIEAARTMLADSKLPTTFWAEAVNTACYVLNKVVGNEPDWLFDVDSLTISMNYVPVVAGNQTNGITGTRDNIVTGQAEKKTEPEQEYILIPFCTTDPLIFMSHKDSEEESRNVPNVFSIDDTGIFGNAYDDEDVGAEADLNNLETTMNVSPIPTTRIDKDHPKDQIIGDLNSAIQNRGERLKILMNRIVVSLNYKQRYGLDSGYHWVTQGYTQEEGIDYDEVFAPVARIEAIRLFLAYASFMGFIMYQMDVKSAFLYGSIKDEVYVCQPPGFEDPHFPDKVYKVEKALYGLHQAPRAWYETLSTYLIENGFRRVTIDKTLFIKKDKGDILLVHVYVDDIIFGSTKKSLCDEFEGLIHKRFQMSSIGELTFFLGLQAQQKEDGIFIS